MKTGRTFSELLQTYFTERLLHQRQASPNTIASYRDTFSLLLKFAQRALKKLPTTLSVADLDAGFISRFLRHLEADRGNAPQSRNVRLAAIHSFFRFVALQEPALGAIAQRVLAIQGKRRTRKSVDFLTPVEMDALLSVPNLKTWSGRRDRTLLLIALETGLRVSELLGLRCQDVALETGAHIRCTGKGRKTRSVPLHKEAVGVLRHWLRERNGSPSEVLFPNARGQPLSRDGFEYLLAQHLKLARRQCPSLKTKRVSPHVLRHSTAMNLLSSGVDCSIIALWLGHESIETTQVYLHASLELKEQALARTQPFNTPCRRYQPPDQLLDFLKGLQ